MNEKQRLLHLLERLLETYKEKIKLELNVFLCSTIELLGGWKIYLTKGEKIILLYFVHCNRPVRRGMIGYDKEVKPDGRAYWYAGYRAPNDQLPNYQSRLNFLVKHVAKLKKELDNE